MRILVITNKWPSAGRPDRVPFLVQQVDHLRRLGLAVDLFVFPGHKNPLNYSRAWIRLRQTHRLQDYDLIHAHFGQSGLLALPRVRPLVVTFHGSDLQGDVGESGSYTWRGRLLQRVSGFVARHADANIVVSAHLQRFLPAGCRAEVIPCGVNLALFRPGDRAQARSRLGWPAGTKVVLFAADPGRPVKRFGLAAAAVALLDGPPEVALIAPENVAHGDMPDYFNASDVLLLTSRHEGSPTVVKEALACDVAVVTVNVGDVTEQLAGIAGCVVCADDAPATIAAGLRLALAHGRVDGRPAVVNLDEARIAGRVAGVYAGVLARAGRPA